MYIDALRVRNHRSFHSETSLEFSPGFNIVLGANNSGKSTVVQALSPWISPVPHQSHLAPPLGTSPYDPTGEISVRYVIPVTEISRIAENRLVCFDMQVDGGNFQVDSNVAIQWFLQEPLRLDLLNKGNVVQQQLTFRYIWLGNTSISRPNGGGPNGPVAQATFALDGRIQKIEALGGVGDVGVMVSLLPQRLNRHVFSFAAERKTFARSSGGSENLALNPGLENLAACINGLSQTDARKYALLNDLLRRIFPHINRVQAPHASSEFHLETVFVSPAAADSEFRRSIADQGSGVANVVGMLYATLISDTPKVLILEEPNNFLHPRALRDLLAILGEYGKQHQFFITTHSSDVLRNVRASTVTMLEHDGAQTTIRQEQGSQIHKFRSSLISLGISLNELHARDYVLWAEGKTEQAVLPLILEKFFPSVAQKIAVLPLVATGDFESRRLPPDRVAAIYRRLSESNFLAPPMVGILLDRELRRQEEVAAIEASSDQMIRFLPKQMFENYLLNAGAIAALVNRLVDPSKQIATADVSNLLTAKIHDSEKESGGLHAAKVLGGITWDLCATEYDKVEHGAILVEWILENQPAIFEELQSFLTDVLATVK